ncbi:hypothetical protein [Magnetofaba australis]|uniref:Putative bacteriophage-like protein n=1 Tax=Magnetofaba australis IT-1 TaxID=1434232 RepID=A0A1Y2K4L4_9PROT|nr:hypothetical protein [Magnetofaba australis]OSM04179.1 putative bacteriophage-like protein [Magnetofaba australis IT-1]
MQATLSPDGQNIIIRIPLNMKRMGGRKAIIPPEGSNSPFRHSHRADKVLLKALGRAHRWLEMLENGEVGSIKALAAQEELDDSYVTRILRLTLLAPEIVAAIINGMQPEGLTWKVLSKPFPVEWERQRELWM